VVIEIHLGPSVGRRVAQVLLALAAAVGWVVSSMQEITKVAGGLPSARRPSMAQRSGFSVVGRAIVTILALMIIPVLGRAIEVGDEAPDFALADLDGLTHTLSGYTTNPVLLMFLGCDSEVSLAVAPLVQHDFYNVFAGRGLRILGIECEGNNHEALTRFRNETGVGFPLLLDGEETMAAYELPISSFVVVDGSGIVRYVAPGPSHNAYDQGAMAEVIDQILREVNAQNEHTWGQIKSLYTD
jgi:peroxiredoxin